ncbi:MAG: hypothetical protein IJN94_01160 [Clostridia bacterium]|nr:hypothetical protein [Clostridia bacterium]
MQRNIIKSSFKDLSKEKSTNKPLVKNTSTAYNYEKYAVETLFPRNPFKVVDAIFIKNNNIYLFEFKRGFEQIINPNNFDIKKWLCPNQELCRKDGSNDPIYCNEGAGYFKENQRLKLNELKFSLHGKLLETHTVLHRYILPKCKHSNVTYTVWFVAVVDKINMPLEETQDILNSISGKEDCETNTIQDLRTSFSKFKRCGEDSNPLFYDKIEVWSIDEFEEKIKLLT